MSDGGRDRASLGMNVWKSSQKWRPQRSAVRSIVWLGLTGSFIIKAIASDRLPATSWTRFDVAAEQVKHPTRRAAIIAFCVRHRIFLKAVCDAVILLRIDDKLLHLLSAIQVALPFLLPVCAVHRPNETQDQRLRKLSEFAASPG